MQTPPQPLAARPSSANAPQPPTLPLTARYPAHYSPFVKSYPLPTFLLTKRPPIGTVGAELSVANNYDERTRRERAMTLDIESFERAIVRHCSPTLAGMKPGCLFNVPGAFAADTNEEPAAQLAAWRAAQELCARLDTLVEAECRLLEPSGVTVRVVARRRCGALVYVYRPDLLARALRKRRVSERLNEWGYRTSGEGWLDAALERLSGQLESCHRKDPDAGFPHEVGFFLGYPYDDVIGFIEHHGHDYLCCGCWKVYAEVERAEACFARYRRCTQAYTALLAMGASIADLALVRIGEAA